MTVVTELAGTGFRICLAESGSHESTNKGNALQKLHVDEGLEIKPYSRERRLGGCSTTWAGLSSPLDEIDFSPRDFMEFSGWPISREELIPYYKQASERYRFPRLESIEGRPSEKARHHSDLRASWAVLEEKTFLAQADAQNFWKEHGDIFENHSGCDCYYNLSIKRLCTSQSGEIQTAEARTAIGRRITIEAKTFVLACGGIENARILLNSNDLHPAGLGNQYDQVGRYFMNHPKVNSGTLRLTKNIRDSPYYFGAMQDGLAGYTGLRFCEDEQRKLGVLNSYVRFVPVYPWSKNAGVEGLVYFVKKCKSIRSYLKWQSAKRIVPLRDYSETGDDSLLQNAEKSILDYAKLVGLIAVNLPTVFRYGWSRLMDKRNSPPITKVELRNFLEMEPHPENRVSLGNELDLHGDRIAKVSYQLTDLDLRSICELHKALAKEVSRQGIGTLESDIENHRHAFEDASHHMGTTRMGKDAASSVVDENCRIHGVRNVYLAGSSVFPTSGCANPTYTIVALSIRLAAHLRLNHRQYNLAGCTYRQ